MKEIGGYIELDTYRFSSLSEGAVKLNLARNCLAYLIEARGINSILIPRLLCGSVADICRKYGVKVTYYSVDEGLNPVIQEVHNNTWLYVVNYYGQLPNDKIKKLKEIYGNIIIDNCQSFYQMPVEGVDTIYTCRKYFGVPDGAYLYTDARIERQLEQDVSYDRMLHILGRYEKNASDFYGVYTENEKAFNGKPVLWMSKLTDNLLRGIDYEYVRRARDLNYCYLRERFQDINMLDLPVVPDGPFMYPLYIKEGARIRGELHKRKIYIPTLWPDVFRLCSDTDLEYNLAADILPLPVDQRYNTDDMKLVYENIIEFIHKEKG